MNVVAPAAPVVVPADLAVSQREAGSGVSFLTALLDLIGPGSTPPVEPIAPPPLAPPEPVVDRCAFADAVDLGVEPGMNELAPADEPHVLPTPTMTHAVLPPDDSARSESIELIVPDTNEEPEATVEMAAPLAITPPLTAWSMLMPVIQPTVQTSRPDAPVVLPRATIAESVATAIAAPAIWTLQPHLGRSQAAEKSAPDDHGAPVAATDEAGDSAAVAPAPAAEFDQVVASLVERVSHISAPHRPEASAGNHLPVRAPAAASDDNHSAEPQSIAPTVAGASSLVATNASAPPVRHEVAPVRGDIESLAPGRPASKPLEGPVRHVTLELDAARTGATRIRIAVQGSQVRATITASEFGAATLDRQLPELRRSLEERGFADIRLAVRAHEPAGAIAAGASPSTDDSHTFNRGRPDGKQPAPARDDARDPGEQQQRRRRNPQEERN